MAGKKMSAADIEQAAQAMGIDPKGAVDWRRVLEVIAVIAELLRNWPGPRAAALASLPPGHEDHDVFCACHEAAAHALESARLSLECCENLSGYG